jgi:hypothetical protein
MAALITRSPFHCEIMGVADQRAQHIPNGVLRPDPQQVRLHAAQAKDVPGEIHEIARPYLLHDVARHQSAPHLSEELVVAACVLAMEQGGLPGPIAANGFCAMSVGCAISVGWGCGR